MNNSEMSFSLDTDIKDPHQNDNMEPPSNINQEEEAEEVVFGQDAVLEEDIDIPGQLEQD